jgi:ketosteroid isomerase-like protein
MRRALAFLATLILASPSCHRTGPEAAIRKAFQSSVDALEKGDASAAADVLSPSFLGPEGMDRAGAEFYLAGLLRSEKVGVTVFSDTLEVDGPRAVQKVQMVLTGRTGRSLLPEERGRATFLIRWERKDGDWKIREILETT